MGLSQRPPWSLRQQDRIPTGHGQDLLRNTPPLKRSIPTIPDFNRQILRSHGSPICRHHLQKTLLKTGTMPPRYQIPFALERQLHLFQTTFPFHRIESRSIPRISKAPSRSTSHDSKTSSTNEIAAHLLAAHKPKSIPSAATRVQSYASDDATSTITTSSIKVSTIHFHPSTGTEFATTSTCRTSYWTVSTAIYSWSIAPTVCSVTHATT